MNAQWRIHVDTCIHIYIYVLYICAKICGLSTMWYNCAFMKSLLLDYLTLHLANPSNCQHLRWLSSTTKRKSVDRRCLWVSLNIMTHGEMYMCVHACVCMHVFKEEREGVSFCWWYFGPISHFTSYCIGVIFYLFINFLIDWLFFVFFFFLFFFFM